MLPLALLAALLPGAAPALDRDGVPLPEGAIARLGTLRFAGVEPGPVVYSADGKLIATTDKDRVVLWDAGTGQRRSDLAPAGSAGAGIRALAFSHDGRFLAAAYRHGPARVWAVRTGQQTRTVAPPPGEVTLIGFTPDDRGLLLGGPESVRGLDLATGKSFLDHRGPGALLRPALSADGDLLALDGEQTIDAVPRRTIRVLDTTTGQERCRFQPPPLDSAALVFTPDGKALVLVDVNPRFLRGCTASFHDTTTGKQVRSWDSASHPTGEPAPLAISPDGTTLAHAGLLRDAATGRRLRVLGQPAVGEYSFSPDGKTLALGLAGGVLYLLDTATGLPRPEGPQGHRRDILRLAVAPDGRTVATVSLDQTIRLWDAATGQPLRCFGGPLPDWNAPGTYALDGVGRFLCLAFSPDGKLLATGGERIVLWDVATGKEAREIRPRPGRTDALAFSPDGKTLISASARDGVQFWDVTGAGLIPHTSTELAGSDRFAIAPDGTFAVTRLDRVLLLDVPSGKVRRELPGGSHQCAFSPDGRLLASLQGLSSVRFQSTTTGQTLGELAPPAPRLLPDERLGPLPVTIARQLGSADRTTFSPDGRTLMGIEDGCLCLWEVLTGQERVRVPMGGVTLAAFALDGKALVTVGGAGHAAYVWDIDRLVAPGRGAPAPFWDALAGHDARAAYRAVRALTRDPDAALSVLRQVRPAPTRAPRQLRQWIADLDDDDFDTRERASAALAQVGDGTRSLLEQARPASPEQKRRIAELLEQLGQPLPGERLRTLRAIEVLEAVATPAARDLLRALARGGPGVPETDHALAALQRLRERGP